MRRTGSCRSSSRSCPRRTTKSRAVEPFREKSAAGGAVPGGDRGRLASRHLLRQYLRPARAPELGDGGAVAARGQSRPPLPDRDPAGAAGPAAVPPVRWLHRVLRGMGRCTPSRSAKSSACTQDPTSTTAASRASCCGPSASSSTPACTRRAGRREQVLEYMDANSSAVEARRASETDRYIVDPRPGARLQGRAAQDPRAARARPSASSGRPSISAGSTTAVLGAGPCRSTCSRPVSIAGSPASAETGGRSMLNDVNGVRRIARPRACGWPVPAALSC